MGLKKKTEQIASETARDVANAIAATIIQQIEAQGSASNNTVGLVEIIKIKDKDPSKFITKDLKTGQESTLRYTGDRPLGPKSIAFANGSGTIG